MADADARRTIIAFAHRGGMAHRPENTMAAFVHAQSLGARAMETDAWITRDGFIVLDHDGVVSRGGVEIPIDEVDRAELPDHIPTLEEYYAACGTSLPLSIDVKDAAAAARIVEIARAAGADAVANLWLCHWDVDVLTSWRGFAGAAHLVHSAETGDLAQGVRSHVRRLTIAGIEVLNLHESDVVEDTAEICHDAGIRLFGWNAHDERRIARLLALGVDGIYSNDVTLMTAGVAAAGLDLA